MNTDKKLSAEEALTKIRKAVDAGDLGFQCCFCHDGIEGDVHALVIVTKWNGPRDTQRQQQWFCHAECFTKATGERLDVLK